MNENWTAYIYNLMWYFWFEEEEKPLAPNPFYSELIEMGCDKFGDPET